MLLGSQKMLVKRSALMGRALQEKLKERLEEKEKKARMLAASATTFDDSALYSSSPNDDEEIEDMANFTRDKVKDLIESPIFEYMILALVILYVLVVFVLIIIDDPTLYKCPRPQYLKDLKFWINLVDLTILIVFGLEIILNVIVHGLAYLKDVLLMFDAAVVLVSLVLAVVELARKEADCDKSAPSARTWGRVRGVLRLLRIVIVFRKIASAEKLIEKSRHGSQLQITSPAERVLRLLNQLKDNRVLPYAVRREIEYAIQKVSSNKLYEPIVEGENGQDEGKEEYSGWITQGYKHETKKKEQTVVTKSVKADEMKNGGSLKIEQFDDSAGFVAGNALTKEWQILAALSGDVLGVLENVDVLVSRPMMTLILIGRTNILQI
jgi:hypothetical protein